MKAIISATAHEKLGRTGILTADSEELGAVLRFASTSERDKFLLEHPPGMRFVLTGTPTIRSERIVNPHTNTIITHAGKELSHLDLSFFASKCEFITCYGLQRDICFVSGLVMVERATPVESERGEARWRGMLSQAEDDSKRSFYSTVAYDQAARAMENLAVEGSPIYLEQGIFSSSTQEVESDDGIVKRRYTKIVVKSVRGAVD